MKKNTLLKISPIMLLLGLLAGSANIAFADEKAAEAATGSEKAAGDTADKSEGTSDKKSDAAGGDKKKDEKEPDCD